MIARSILALLLSVGLALSAEAVPTNVILMIGDGMGPQHEQAARYYSGGSLAWDNAPNQAQMTTHSLTGVTDSAAAATAMATGQKVISTAISTDLLGNPLPTSLEHHKAQGKSTGLVTTVGIEDATPAAFGAHESLRFFFSNITDDYLNDSRPNLLVGAATPAGGGIDPTRAANAGYTVFQDRAQMNALDITLPTHVSGQIGDFTTPFEWEQANGDTTHYDTQPYLSETAAFALSFLEQDPDGFFLMVEQEHTDEAGHLDNSDPNKLIKSIFATLEFSLAVQLVLDWIAARPDPSDTLLIVTADHETGGLALTGDNGAGNLPTHSWLHDVHTGQNVNVYGWGQGSEQVSGVIDNTDIFHITTVPEPRLALLGALALVIMGIRKYRLAS